MMKSTESRCYFDWAATAPPFEDSQDSDAAHHGIYGNPSSLHYEGRKARETLEEARSRCAAVLGVKPETLYFSSGGTESNNLVLYSLIKRKGKGRILFSEIEHPSIRENCFVLERLEVPVSPVAAEKDGRVSVRTLGRALERNPDTRMAALMAVNNETGAVMDIKELVALIRQRENAPVHFHCDLVQAAGKIPIDISGWGIDSASISGHKLGGPRGIGLLYLRKPVETLFAGTQERGIRGGTENTEAALALAKVLEKRAIPDIVMKESCAAALRWSRLIGALKKIKRCVLIPEDRNETDERFSPWILQVRFKGVPGEVMLRALDSEGFAVSTGSACSSAHTERPVLKAMGLDGTARLEGIRISQGWTTSAEDIKGLIEGIEKVLNLL